MSVAPRRLLLHIGTMKSGTTYLQRTLARQQAALQSHGWHYPLLPVTKGHPYHNHEYAMFGLLGSRIPWISAERAGILQPQWHSLKGLIASCEGSVLLSAESLAALDSEGIHYLLDNLQFPEVRVVVTLRDLGRIIPSSWQQHARNGRLTPFAEYLDTVQSAREGAGDRLEGVHFWRSYRLDALVSRWTGIVGTGRLTLVTSPHQGAPDVLWRRFIEACGAPEALKGLGLQLDRRESHQSVSWPMAIALQRMAQEWADGGIEYRDIKRRMRALEWAIGEDGEGPPIRVPGDWIARVREWAEHDVAAARAAGVRLVGDWGDLLVSQSYGCCAEPTHHQVEDAWLRLKQAIQAD